MHIDLDREVQKINQNFPYLVLVTENSSVQLFLVAERLVLHECSSFMSGLLSLIAAYFTFNIEYPKPLYAPCIFIQHIVFNIKDKQATPAPLVRLLSSLDNIE